MKQITDKECCYSCAFCKNLILWNKDGNDTPNYEEPSRCCILWAKQGDVHQLNRNGFCECFQSIEDFNMNFTHWK